MTRRIFNASLLLATTGAGGIDVQASSQPYWYERIRRLGQPNLNEKDAATVNVEKWVQYWSSLKADGLIVSAGGIVAFYPTQVPHHQRSRYLGKRDVYGEFVEAMGRRNMRVIARLDPNWGFREALDAEPNWFARDRSGLPIHHAATAELYRTCMFGHYFDEHIKAIIVELRDRYKTDGFYTNGWPSTGLGNICYCAVCREKYRQNFSAELPEQADRRDPNYRRWTEWRMARVLEVWDLWQNTAAQGHPERVYVGNLGGSIRAETNVKEIAGRCKWMNADHQDRLGATPMWDCAQQGRVCYSVMRGRTSTNVTSAYNLSDAVWRHTSKAPVEMRSWLAQTAASGMVPWETWLGGEPKDTRWQQPSREFFDWLAANERHYFNLRSLSDVGLVWPQRTQVWHPRLGQNTDALQGYYYALLEARIPFDIVHDEDITRERVAQYKVIVLPNAALLSDATCATLRDYHRSGGSLVATFETSLYNEWGESRKDFALGEVFGASIKGPVEGPLQNSYLQVERHHAILNGLGATSFLPGPIFRVPIQDVPDPILTRIPPYPAYPVEFVFPKTTKTAGPSVVIREDKGRVIYFSDDIDRTFWRSWNPDLGLMLANAVRWAGRDAFSAKVTGAGLFDIFYWETESGLALHLVNYTTPALMKGPARAISTVGQQEIRLQMPEGFRAGKASTLSNSKEVAFHAQGSEFVCVLPQIGEYEVVAIERST